MKNKIIIILINLLLLIGFIACILVGNSIISPLLSQQAAERWSGDSGERFSQVTAFFPENHLFTEQDVFAVRQVVDSALLTASIDVRDDRTFYIDAWSAEGTVNVIGQRGASAASVIGVGGDFFSFHPLQLRDGSYINPNDVMRDRVILDEELAWRLFGSVYLAGLEVLINNQPFIIAGVVSRESDFASRRALRPPPAMQDVATTTDMTIGLYMSFEALNELAALNEDQAKITSYEIVMPDPISNFALTTISDHFNDSNVLVVENTDRFALTNILSSVSSFGERSMLRVPISLPYWENAARLAEDFLALLLVIAVVLIITPVVFSIIYLIKLGLYLIKLLKRTIKRIIDEKENKKYEKYLTEQAKNSRAKN